MIAQSPVGVPDVGWQRLEVPINRYSTIYAIGDIHGRLDLLKGAESRIISDIGQSSDHLVVCLGDYVDRGPASAEVLQHLSRKETPYFDGICLCGDLDDVMLQFLQEPKKHMGWLELGGKETLPSYRVDAEQLLRHDPSGEELKAVLRSRSNAAYRLFGGGTGLAVSGRVSFCPCGRVAQCAS